jgi:hypothetical protein
VIGDSVNTAARLESNGAPATVCMLKERLPFLGEHLAQVEFVVDDGTLSLTPTSPPLKPDPRGETDDGDGHAAVAVAAPRMRNLKGIGLVETVLIGGIAPCGDSTKDDGGSHTTAMTRSQKYSSNDCRPSQRETPGGSNDGGVPMPRYNTLQVTPAAQ